MRIVDISPKRFRALSLQALIACACFASIAPDCQELEARPHLSQNQSRDLRNLPNIAPGPDMPPAVPIEVARERSGRAHADIDGDGEATNDARSDAGEQDQPLLPGRGMPASASDSGFGWSRAERGTALVTMAESYLGLPYLYGGSKPQTGFDCSGFTGYLYAKFGIALPRSAYAQSVSKALRATREPAPGDLVFFKINRKRVSHVGLYVGGDIFIHSPRTGKNIEFGNLKLKYWKTRFAGARRPI